MIRSRVTHHAARPVPPGDFDPQLVGQRPGGERPHRLVRREVAPATDHLLRLHRNRAAEDFDLRPEAVRVRRAAFQSHRDARRGGIIAVEERRAVEGTQDHVEVTVVVEVGANQPVAHLRCIKAPGRARFYEGPIAAIAENIIRREQPGKGTQLPARRLHPLPHRLHGRVEVLRVVGVAVAHEQVFVTIEIHIEKSRRPRPVGGGQAGEVRQFRVGAVASIPEHRVAANLRAVLDLTDLRGRQVRLDHLRHAQRVLTA